jgi:hypothetical protein
MARRSSTIQQLVAQPESISWVLPIVQVFVPQPQLPVPQPQLLVPHPTVQAQPVWNSWVFAPPTACARLIRPRLWSVSRLRVSFFALFFMMSLPWVDIFKVYNLGDLQS